jgi:3-oxoacyl-[acyl-carrier protein] reductase
VVTGVGTEASIGFATVHALHAQGAAVLAHLGRPFDGSDLEDRGTVARRLSALGDRVHICRRDLADPTAPGELVDLAVRNFGRIDIVVAAHAESSEGAVAEVTATTLDHCFAVNTRATILLAKSFLEYWTGASGGRLIFFTSGQDLGPMPGEIAYVASKGAVHQITRTVAAEVAHLGITVNTINPGPTDTGWASAEVKAELLGRLPMGRWGTAEDAARLVSWLASDDGAWITGQVISSDGGFRA